MGLGFMYDWLSAMFGNQLSDFLWGYDCESAAYTRGAVYDTIGLVSIGIVIVSLALFYKFIDHPRWSNRWLPWIFFGGCTCFVNLLIAGVWTSSLLNNGVMGDCLNVNTYQCWMFGVANAVITTILFVCLSFLFKKFSKNNKHTPWK